MSLLVFPYLLLFGLTASKDAWVMDVWDTDSGRVVGTLAFLGLEK